MMNLAVQCAFELNFCHDFEAETEDEPKLWMLCLVNILKLNFTYEYFDAEFDWDSEAQGWPRSEILPRLTQKIVTSPTQLFCGKHWTLGSILPWTMFSKCVLQLGREEMSMKMPRWWWQDGAPFQRGGLRWYFGRQLKRFCSRKCSTLSSGNCSNGGNSNCNIQLCMWFWFHLWQEPYNVNFDHMQKLLHHWLIKSFRPQNHFTCALTKNQHHSFHECSHHSWNHASQIQFHSPRKSVAMNQNQVQSYLVGFPDWRVFGFWMLTPGASELGNLTSHIWHYKLSEFIKHPSLICFDFFFMVYFHHLKIHWCINVAKILFRT